MSKFKKGEVLFGIGNCERRGYIVDSFTFVRYLPKSKCKDYISEHTGNRIVQDCVIHTDGFNMIDGTPDMYRTRAEAQTALKAFTKLQNV